MPQISTVSPSHTSDRQGRQTADLMKFLGNGFSTVKKLYTTTKDAVADYDSQKNRIWTMENPNKQNKATGSSVAYKLSK